MRVMKSRIETGGEVAAQIAQAAGTAAACGRRFVFAISPAAITQQAIDLLAQDERIRSTAHVFLADTRFGACGRSGAEVRAMLERLPVRRSHLHLDVADQGDYVLAAGAYEQELRAFFGLSIGDLPRFDAIVLQSESGGGTAGVPARSRAIEETCRLAIANRAREGGARFVTLTPPVIQCAGRLFVTSCTGQPWRSAA
jgi:hypothetical protein